ACRKRPIGPGRGRWGAGGELSSRVHPPGAFSASPGTGLDRPLRDGPHPPEKWKSADKKFALRYPVKRAAVAEKTINFCAAVEGKQTPRSPWPDCAERCRLRDPISPGHI